MIRFLLRGIWKDKGRSVLPIIVVTIGVALTVLLTCWINGVMGESLVMNANFNTGHVKVTTRAYMEEAEQMPNDLALLNADAVIAGLKSNNPGMDFVKRIRFGGIIDFPDSSGETRAQGPVVGWAIDLYSEGTREIGRFNIEKSIVSGAIPKSPGEALITSVFAEKFGVKAGDQFTLFSSTMDGSMAFANFQVTGTVKFGSTVLDRGAVILDITDVQRALHMDDAAGEILGYFDSDYDNEKASAVAAKFNTKYAKQEDEYAPVMQRLSDQGGMSEYIELSGKMGGILIFVFVLAMSVVLWNTGLLGGLRRYNEFGVRLALGEEKGHIYSTLLYEAILIGLIGSVIGTVVGLGISYYIQIVGIDIGSSMKNSTLMMPSVVRTSVTPSAFYIGFFPGVVAMIMGNALAGLGIYKRKTAELFKELE